MRIATLAAALAVLMGWTVAYAVQTTFPDKPIRLVIGSAPGSGPDIISRTLADRLYGAWGQRVVVDSRPGVAGILSADLVLRAVPDGYTWMMLTSQLLVATAVVIVLNALPSVVFPAVSGGRWSFEASFLGRLRAHAVASLAGCYFFFFGLVALQGVMLNVLRPRAFGRLSPGAFAQLGDAAWPESPASAGAEVGLWPHVRGALAVLGPQEAAAPDFFFDLVDAPQLDHVYAVFGQVLNGIDFLQQIAEGDEIESIEILP